MTSAIADGVLAATHRLVEQAMSGDWQAVPKTLAERRALLERLSADASAKDQQWLAALKQAMAESDAVVASLTPVAANQPAQADSSAFISQQAVPMNGTAAVDVMMDMIGTRKS
ncbi:MAG TPA: hypothetical protein VIL28_10575 [Steroidobacteraceae bacterium]